jgi:hypothetical protein
LLIRAAAPTQTAIKAMPSHLAHLAEFYGLEVHQIGMNNELRAVAFDDSGRASLTEDVRYVGSNLLKKRFNEWMLTLSSAQTDFGT